MTACVANKSQGFETIFQRPVGLIPGLAVVSYKTAAGLVIKTCPVEVWPEFDHAVFESHLPAPRIFSTAIRWSVLHQ
jgi:hypothetical protein